MSKSNDELRQIVTDALVGMISGVTGLVPPTVPGSIPGFVQGPIDRAVEKISAALPVGVPDVQLTGHLDEVDAPVWEFIHSESRKLGPLTGSIDSYNFARPNGAQPNGVVVVLWNGQKIHALALTVRDAMNRTQCLRLLAAASTVKESLSVHPVKAATDDSLSAAVDAAMVEMRNISPPLRRSECERLLRAALPVLRMKQGGGQ